MIAGDDLGREYAAALRTYLDGGDEPALSYAYELGRRAMVDGLGVIDLAMLHHDAVRAVVGDAPAPEGADAAANFFREALSPFELALRGYRAANDELRRLNEELLSQKDALEVVNRELESFSYSVSHDLRAPLRSIDGFGAILAEEFGEVLGDEGKSLVAHIRTSTTHMARLIEDLLALARVTRTEVHRSEIDMSALVREILDRLRAASPARRAVFSIEDGVRGYADARLLAIVFENLLGNAWKFTSRRAQAEIAFGCQERDGARVYYVRDNGAGYDMAYTAKLFGAFQRLHSRRDFEGTGIGLATVQRIVHRHGGRVWAEGRVDGGATFYFTLKGSPDAPPGSGPRAAASPASSRANANDLNRPEST